MWTRCSHCIISHGALCKSISEQWRKDPNSTNGHAHPVTCVSTGRPQIWAWLWATSWSSDLPIDMVYVGVSMSLQESIIEKGREYWMPVSHCIASVFKVTWLPLVLTCFFNIALNRMRYPWIRVGLRRFRFLQLKEREHRLEILKQLAKSRKLAHLRS